MKPANRIKAMGRPAAEPFIGIPEIRMESQIELGCDSAEKIKALEKPGRLHEEMMDCRRVT